MAAPLALTINDEDLAVWMPINNTFARGHPPPPRGANYWCGFLIQLGKYFPYPNPTNQWKELVESVRFDPQTTRAHSLTRSELAEGRWINVIALRAGRTPQPMLFGDLSKLFLLPPPVSLHRYFQPS